MWQIAVNPRMFGVMRNAIKEVIQRRDATLRILYRLSSSEAMRAECSDDSIKIGRLSENVCRSLILEDGRRDRLWSIERDLAWAIYDINYEYREKKSIIDRSCGAEDVLNEVWSKYRREFRRVIQRLNVYFGCVHVRSTFQRWLMLV